MAAAGSSSAAGPPALENLAANKDLDLQAAAGAWATHAMTFEFDCIKRAEDEPYRLA